MRMYRHTKLLAATCLSILLFANVSNGATLSIKLIDQHGEPVEDAVMYIKSIDGKIPASSPMQVDVDQIDEAFVPHVRAATIGSSVNFPNSDHIRHHVYSFSEALTFEVPLYIGVPTEPTLFEKSGLITLGCNIHDHMLGYLLILDTPYFSEINAGAGKIENIPAGELAVEVWHPRLLDIDIIERTLQASADETLTLNLELNLRPERRVRRAPRRGSSRY